MCSETSQLIENHDKIAELSAVHYNLGKTLEDVENIMALPNEAAMAEELLRDDMNLLQVSPIANGCFKTRESRRSRLRRVCSTTSGQELSSLHSRPLSAEVHASIGPLTIGCSCLICESRPLSDEPAQVSPIA